MPLPRVKVCCFAWNSRASVVILGGPLICIYYSAALRRRATQCCGRRERFPLKATADEASERVVSNTEAIKKRDSGPRSRLLDQRSFQASSQTICVPTICTQLICAYASSATGFELGRANPRPSSQATLRGFVAVFRPARCFFRNATTVFFVLGAALTEDGKSSLGCFAVRWWPWFRGWMRADSSSICS